MNIKRKCLVLGNGRAGKRHVKSAIANGLIVHIFDPYDSSADYHVEEDIPWFNYDYAVIASPPDKHLEQIGMLLDNKMVHILCEKPLCSMAEHNYITLPEDAPVMLAYNWQYNDQVMQLKGTSKNYSLFAEQSRALPEWGIENDHLPHDLFIIDYVSGGIKSITNCSLVKSEMHQEVYVEGKTRTGTFNISERVLVKDTPRISKLNGTDLIPDSVMFDRLWQAFLNNDYSPSLKDGMRVQGFMSDIWNRLQRKVAF